MAFLPYLALAFSGYVLSVSTWNRCRALGGQNGSEPILVDILVTIAVPLTVWAFKTLFSV